MMSSGIAARKNDPIERRRKMRVKVQHERSSCAYKLKYRSRPISWQGHHPLVTRKIPHKMLYSSPQYHSRLWCFHSTRNRYAARPTVPSSHPINLLLSRIRRRMSLTETFPVNWVFVSMEHPALVCHAIRFVCWSCTPSKISISPY